MNETITCDVAIIGAGTAGLAAWRAATGAGKHAVIVERGPGGTTCARVGCMPSKLMLAAGRAARDARRAGMFGVRTGAVEIDGAAVLARMRAERDFFTASARESWFAVPPEQRIDGAARFVGPTAFQIEDGARIEAGAVIIATGGAPLVPPVLEPVAALVCTNETIFEIEALPMRLAVLGAGAQGMELAQAFAWLGVAVTVIDNGATVAKLSDPEAATIVREAFASLVELRLETELESSELVDGLARLRWTGGQGEFDLVLAASGRPPELKPLDLEAVGLKLDDHGTPLFDPVTRRCGGSAVFMAGDAGANRAVLHEASREGEMAGLVASGLRPRDRLPVLALTFTEPQIALVGCDHDELPDGHRIGQAVFAENGRVRVDESQDAPGVARVYADGEGKLIGGTIVGPGAEHLGHLLAHAVARGLTAAAFEDAVFYHPCVEETLQNAVRDLLRS
ncbi:dihydrolipoyl dehydrogenase [uncultured Sphingomonas sp.]|uniref:dihydrolipoyl dehydrogenase n=1 Tax=uncultured Sphingomonas sp. TaxID=158754 RepID=UPI0035C9BB34